MDVSLRIDDPVATFPVKATKEGSGRVVRIPKEWADHEILIVVGGRRRPQ